MTTWTATSPGDLGVISDLVHDAPFEPAAVRYRSVEQTLCIPFSQEWEPPATTAEGWRDAPRTETLRRTWRFVESRVPFLRGTLLIARATSVSLDERAGDVPTLLGLDYDAAGSTLRVRGVSGDLKAVVETIDLTAELDPTEVARYVRRRRGRLLGSRRDLPDAEP